MENEDNFKQELLLFHYTQNVKYILKIYIFSQKFNKFNIISIYII